MLTFAALMSIITGAVMLGMWADDVRKNGFKRDTQDWIVNILAPLGFTCVIVIGGNQLFMLHY